MFLLKSKFDTRFSLRDKDWKLFSLDVMKDDEYLETEFSKTNFEILKNFKTFGVHTFELIEGEIEKDIKEEEKVKEVTSPIIEKEYNEIIETDLSSQFENKFGKPVPRNKKNDEEWIKSKLQEETPSE